MMTVKSYRPIFYILIVVWIFWSACYTQAKQDYTKTPVFFVHCCGCNAASWNILINNLRKSGYPSEYLRAITLVPDCGANIDAAENQIAPAIETFLSDVNNFLSTNYPRIPLMTKVDLVSHSMGGLSSRWYIVRLRPDRVNKWISLAGSNHGTNDLCSHFSGGADDCCPAYAANERESYIQYQLNGEPHVADVDETPYGIGIDLAGVTRIPPDEDRSIFYVTIRTVNDEWIDPDDSVIVDGAGGIYIPIPEALLATETSSGNIRMDNGVAHAMIHDADTIRLVKIILGIKRKFIKIEHGKKKN